jgi:hypothetical protein
VPNEINIDELKALMGDAQNVQQKKYEAEAKMIIDTIPSKARNAARQGKSKIPVHTFLTDKSNKIDPVSQVVFDWCVEQGLNPTKEEHTKNENPWTNILIHW